MSGWLPKRKGNASRRRVSRLAARSERNPAVVPPLPSFRRVLVREVNWLGDVVMSLPALKALRRAMPAAHLSVQVRGDLASFFDGAGWVNEVLPFRIRPGLAGMRDRWRVVEEIRSEKFDLAVVLPHSFQSAFWVALGGVPERVGFVADARGLLLTSRRRKESVGAHACSR